MLWLRKIDDKLSGPQKNMQSGALCPFPPPKLTKMGGGGDALLSLARWRQVHLTQLKYIPATLVTQEGGTGIYFTLQWSALHYNKPGGKCKFTYSSSSEQCTVYSAKWTVLCPGVEGILTELEEWAGLFCSRHHYLCHHSIFILRSVYHNPRLSSS